MIKKALKILPGALVLSLGLTAIVGWLARIQILLRPGESYIPIMFGGGICFCLAGIGLISLVNSSHLSRIIQRIVGSLLFLIAAITLAEYFFHVDLGVDHLVDISWINVKTLYPGRISFNSSIGFTLTGLIFILHSFAYKKVVAVFIEAAIFVLFLLGMLSLIGYFLNIQVLFNWINYATMSFYSGIVFILLGLSLWYLWRDSAYSDELYLGKEAKKITIVSSVLLLTLSLIVGLACFATLANQQFCLMRKMFLETMQVKSVQFNDEISRALMEYQAIQQNSQTRLHDIDADLFIQEGFSAVTIYDSAGKLVKTKGKFINSKASVKLNLPDDVRLEWQNGWYLTITKPLAKAQWPLTGIDKAFKQISALGSTASIGVCTILTNKQGFCFPSGESLWLKKIDATELGADDAFIMMLSGKTGVVETHDMQEKIVLAAYGPIANLGLVMVVKIEMTELYNPIYVSLKRVFPIIVLAVLLGLILLRLEIIPFIRRMVSAEKELSESNSRLKKSEERYALAVRGSNAGLWDWEVGTDYIFYSPFLKNMLGFIDKELPNSVKAFEAHLHPDDVLKVNQALKDHIINRVPYNIEYRLRRKSGEYHWFRVVGQATWDENGRAVRMAGSIIDVTDRKISEQRLLMQYSITRILSEANKVQDAVSEILHIICMGLQWSYGSLWLVNDKKDKIEYLTSWHEQTTQTIEFENTIKSIYFTHNKGLIGRVWGSGKPYWCIDIQKDPYFLQPEAARRANYNSIFCFPIQMQNQVVGVMEFFNKTIESPDENLLQMMAAIGPQVSQFIQKKNIESELRQSEAHKSAILNSASDSIITITSKGSIVSFNLQTEKIFGYTKDEMTEKNINALIPGITDRMHEIVNKLPVEFLAINKKGENFPAELTMSGMERHGKNIYVIIVRDVTERKKVEKLKNEFVSVVSHELRTPLTSIRGSLGLILGGVVGQFSDKAKNLLDIANNNCDRLLHLINDILDVEKIESGKINFQMMPVDIAKIVKESITANYMYGEKFGVKIALVESVSGIIVNVDFDRMMQVMANLISNAVKFSKRGDSVDVAIKVLNNKVRVSITDYGSGIPLDFQPIIFQKFSQADAINTRGKGGTGLGLNISKSIIEKLGGSIGFITEPDKLTVFYFDLPIWVDEKIIQLAKEIPTEATSKSLLVCEDDEDQAQYIKAMLETSDFHVDIALTAAEARNLLAKKEYQGLLLDLILPDQDGISFIRELRAEAKTRSLPIIVMSVIAKTGHALLNGDAVSVLDWLDKPIDFNKLLKDVSAIKHKNAHVPKIIHVEDDVETREMLKALLHGTAEVTFAMTIQEAKIKLLQNTFDLAILDLILPDGKGTDLIPVLAKSGTPVIVLSAVELDREHAEFVKDALVKSQTSHEKLLELIEKLLHKSA